MDFSYLLELAKTNDKSNTQEAQVSRFSTKLSKPKKVDKLGPKVSAVQAVLDKIESDKYKENEEARKKKVNLLTLRAQDRKSKKRVAAMINMSKGANKAVLDDAKDLTTAKGEEQCDEDDYGYESAMSQTIFSKLANQYANAPDDDRIKFVKKTDKRTIEEIKSRVINNLKKVEEEELGPRKRKRRRKSDGEFETFINDGDAYDASAPSSSEKSDTPSTPKEKVINVNLTNYKSDKHNNFKYDKEKKEDHHDKKRDKDKRDKDKRDKDSRDKDKRDKDSRDKDKRDKDSRDKDKRDKDSRDKDKRDKDSRDKKSDREEKPKKKPKKHNSAPPPLSFMELLRIAQTKQKDPMAAKVLNEKMIKDKEKKKERDRPLTAKEREEYEEERRRKFRRMGKLPPERKEPAKDDSKMSDEDKRGNDVKSKKNGENKQKPGENSKLRDQLESPKPESKVPDRSKYFAGPPGQKSGGPSQGRDVKPQVSKQPPPKPQNSKMEPPKSSKMEPPRSNKVAQSKSSKPQQSREPPEDRFPRKQPSPADRFPKKQAPEDRFPRKQLPPEDRFPKKQPKFSDNNRSRQFPPSDVRRKGMSPPRRRIESDSEESEYDSELDDFIDDGEEELDYRSEISKMFGYDRTKFQDEDDDVDDMEASFSQMQKEERYSAKVGLKEDLEDIQREDEERKRKIMRMKQMKKGKR